MYFYPPKIIRYYYRYLLVGILVVLPLVLLIITVDEQFTAPDQILYPIIICPCFSIIGATIIHFGFWERMFSKLFISNQEIIWSCPFRSTKTLPIDKCAEIGGFWENEGNGIPVAQVYFSNTKNPELLSIRKKMRHDRQIIIFWYSEELYRYIKQAVDSKKTSCLTAYRIQNRNKI